MSAAIKIMVYVLASILIIVPFVGNIFFLWQDWNNYWNVIFWVVQMMRVLCIISAIVAFVMSLSNQKFVLWIDGVSLILIGFWGLPILLNALNLLIFTPLTGIVFQRTILNYIIMEVWSAVTVLGFDHNMLEVRMEKLL
jgi:hypothetical protein